MDKVYKPVPDVEALRYHGTPEKPDIKIFVSHRIDQDSETIDNPLYIPVRCGAVYDQRENVQMLGDDTGDNISEKRFTYNELTIMYWAWKNVKADYYGLCHYRRYLSFSTNQHYLKNQLQYVEADTISPKSVEKFGLNEKSIRNLISKSKADIILPEIFDISEINCDPKFTHRTRYEINLGKQFSQDSIDLLLDALDEIYPEYTDVAKQYFDGNKAYFCNCFIMKRDIFHAYCQWLFDILFYLEPKVDFTGLSMKKSRILGFFSEDLLTIYMMKNLRNNHWMKVEQEIVYFKDTAARPLLKPAFSQHSVNIVLSSDNTYAAYMGVLIQSIIQNSSEKYNYDIIILHTDISEENRILLQSLAGGINNFSIRFTDISNEISDRKFEVWAHYKKYNVYRLVAPDVLANFDKAVYLDSDIVVNKDIADLYNTDVSNYLIAAVPEIRVYSWLDDEDNPMHQYVAEILRLPKGHIYFNSGVLVYNLAKFRNTCSSDYMLDICAQRRWQYIDQDVLNIVCAEDTLYLPMNWNVMISADNLATEINSPLSMYQNYCSARKNPYAVHYAGNFLPFRVPTVDMYWYFWKYARNTPYYEILLDRMIDTKIQVATSHNRTGARKVADLFFPKGTKRRELLKKIIPKGSKRWAVLKQIYYVFNPRFKRPMREDIM